MSNIISEILYHAFVSILSHQKKVKTFFFLSQKVVPSQLRLMPVKLKGFSLGGVWWCCAIPDSHPPSPPHNIYPTVCMNREHQYNLEAKKSDVVILKVMEYQGQLRH